MEPPPASLPASPPDPVLLDRVRGVLPVVRRGIGTVRAVGVASAVAAAVLWAVVFGTRVWPPSAMTLAAVLVLGVLLVPAAGTFLAVLTLREVLDLPARLRALPSAVRDSAREAQVRVTDGEGRARRMFGVFGVVWRLRGIVMDTHGSWLQTLALARFARLASLPFALGLLVAFALNFVVIAAAVVAVLLVVLV